LLTIKQGVRRAKRSLVVLYYEKDAQVVYPSHPLSSLTEITNMKIIPRLIPLYLLLGVPAVYCHPGHGSSVGLTSGLLHPLMGWDHILTMIAVGLWASQLGRRALWQVPLTFVTTMAVFALLGQEFPVMKVYGLEQAIVASVFILGVFLAFSLNVSVKSAMLCVGAFAVFHGIAHGAEMPVSVSGFSYGLGFIIATVTLHLTGMALGLLANRVSIKIPRYVGLAIATAALIGFIRFV